MTNFEDLHFQPQVHFDPKFQVSRACIGKGN